VRLNGGETQAHRLRLLPAPGGAGPAEWRLWDWVERVGPGWQGAVQIDQGAGWRRG
jgi:hypothetical protein